MYSRKRLQNYKNGAPNYILSCNYMMITNIISIISVYHFLSYLFIDSLQSYCVMLDSTQYFHLY